VAQLGSAAGKPIHKPKIDFYDPFSIYISDLYGHDMGVCSSIQGNKEKCVQGNLRGEGACRMCEGELVSHRVTSRNVQMSPGIQKRRKGAQGMVCRDGIRSDNLLALR